MNSTFCVIYKKMDGFLTTFLIVCYKKNKDLSYLKKVEKLSIGTTTKKRVLNPIMETIGFWLQIIMNFWSKQPFSKKSFLTKNIFFFLKHCWSDRSEKLHAGPPDNFRKKKKFEHRGGYFKITFFEKGKNNFQIFLPVYSQTVNSQRLK